MFGSLGLAISGSSPGGVGGYGAYSYSYNIPGSYPGGSYSAASAIDTSGAAVADSGGGGGGGGGSGGSSSGSSGGASLNKPEESRRNLGRFGPFGERGPYTEINYPAMRFLRAGETPTELLSQVRQQWENSQQQAQGNLTTFDWLTLAALLLITL